MLRKSCVAGAVVLTFGLLGGAGRVTGQQVQDARRATATVDEAARGSQASIDRTVDETRSLERQYNETIKEIEGLEIYTTLLEKQVANQSREMLDLNRSIEHVSVIERQVTPLMMKMIDALEQFVELDKPFLLEERRQRVIHLRGLLERSDISVAEKFRRLLEAYEIENDYGRTIEAYKGSLDVDGASREVDFLRIGRTALLYQTVDAEVFGMWDERARKWAPLPAKYRNQIRTGIRIAHKQIAPDLLLLPISGPEKAK